MGKRETWRAKIERAWGDEALLERVLLDGSGLPGPRANLELAAVAADGFEQRADDPAAWSLAVRWSAVDAASAPVNHRREFLPFCGILALGAMHARADAARRAQIHAALTRAANDPRWRMREAAAMAAQRIGGHDFDAVQALVRTWVSTGQPELLRASLAALADAPLLAADGRAAFALEMADLACEAYAAGDSSTRNEEPWRILRKGLEYAPSVFVAAAPAPGFALLRRWAESRQPDIRKIVVANLRKTRLARAFPDEVEAVGQALAWASDEGSTDP